MKNIFNSNLKFFVTGSYAVHLYTGRRVYNDIDIAVQHQDLVQIAKELSVECKTTVSPFNEEYAYVHYNEYEFGTFEINIGDRIVSFGVRSCYSRAKNFKVGDNQIKVISPEDLILLKLTLAREENGKMDIQDAQLLLETQNLDYGYLCQKAYELGLFAKLDMISKQLKDRNLEEVMNVQTHYRFYFLNKSFSKYNVI